MRVWVTPTDGIPRVYSESNRLGVFNDLVRYVDFESITGSVFEFWVDPHEEPDEVVDPGIAREIFAGGDFVSARHGYTDSERNWHIRTIELVELNPPSD